jgi:hypothetical protein
VVGDAAELGGGGSSGVNDGAVNVLLAIDGLVRVGAFIVGNVHKLVGRNVLVEVGQGLLDQSFPVAASLLDVVEVVLDVGGFVGVPHDLALEGHNVLGGVRQGDELAAGMGQVFSLLGLRFPGLGLGELAVLELIEWGSVGSERLDAVENGQMGLSLLDLGLTHGDADDLVALELHGLNPVEGLLAVGGD